MLFDLDNQYIKSHLGEAEFGIERESLRVTSSGALAQTKHPFGEHRNIDRDFCENQVEIIGDVFNTPEELIGQLLELENEIIRKEKDALFGYPPQFLVFKRAFAYGV